MFKFHLGDKVRPIKNIYDQGIICDISLLNGDLFPYLVEFDKGIGCPFREIDLELIEEKSKTISGNFSFIELGDNIVNISIKGNNLTKDFLQEKFENFLKTCGF